MNSFALYRLPHQQQCWYVEQTNGQPLGLLSCTPLNDEQGFVVAPFEATQSHPLLVIRPDIERCGTIDEVCDYARSRQNKCRRIYDSRSISAKASLAEERNIYAEAFRVFHKQLSDEAMRKVVLSRTHVIPSTETSDPVTLFQRACRHYPRMLISLTYTPKSGMWLAATPEILLEKCGERWLTIALAGTMKLSDSELQGEGENTRWSAKNIEEQRYVATYLHDCLRSFSNDVQELGPCTVRAANLVHLRSDFLFTMTDKQVGSVLQMLHPTPAVCGLPKEAAMRFILAREPSSRTYYSGFMGPLGLSAGTHLFVSLRCMQILPDCFRLYAGGGLLKDSIEEEEWQETEAKLDTMRQIIG